MTPLIRDGAGALIGAASIIDFGPTPSGRVERHGLNRPVRFHLLGGGGRVGIIDFGEAPGTPPATVDTDGAVDWYWRVFIARRQAQLAAAARAPRIATGDGAVDAPGGFATTFHLVPRGGRGGLPPIVGSGLADHGVSGAGSGAIAIAAAGAGAHGVSAGGHAEIAAAGAASGHAVVHGLGLGLTAAPEGAARGMAWDGAASGGIAAPTGRAAMAVGGVGTGMAMLLEAIATARGHHDPDDEETLTQTLLLAL